MISPLLLDDFWSNPGIILLLILVCFGLVALLVFLLRKYVPFFKSDEKVKTPEEIAKEEVDRLVEEIDEEGQKAIEEAEERRKEEQLGISREDDSLERALSDVDDEETSKAMAAYREEHPEEEAEAQKKTEEKDQNE